MTVADKSVGEDLQQGVGGPSMNLRPKFPIVVRLERRALSEEGDLIERFKAVLRQHDLEFRAGCRMILFAGDPFEESQHVPSTE